MHHPPSPFSILRPSEPPFFPHPPCTTILLLRCPLLLLTELKLAHRNGDGGDSQPHPLQGDGWRGRGHDKFALRVSRCWEGFDRKIALEAFVASSVSASSWANPSPPGWKVMTSRMREKELRSGAAAAARRKRRRGGGQFEAGREGRSWKEETFFELPTLLCKARSVGLLAETGKRVKGGGGKAVSRNKELREGKKRRARRNQFPPKKTARRRDRGALARAAGGREKVAPSSFPYARGKTQRKSLVRERTFHSFPSDALCRKDMRAPCTLSVEADIRFVKRNRTFLVVL